MSHHNPVLPKGTAVALPPAQLLDARGRPYVPAVSPRLKALLAFIFMAVALLGATGVYLVAVRLMNWLHAPTSYENPFTLWMYSVHLGVGILFVFPFLFFGCAHLLAARRRPNRRAVRLGIALFVSGMVVVLSGVALIQLEGLVQLPTDSLARAVMYALHSLLPLAAVVLYVLHRLAGPEIQWKWGIGWGAAVGSFVLVMGVMHAQDPRKWYAKGSPEGEKYFEPAQTRTVDGNFIRASTLMMDEYCLRCHPNIYHDHLHSAHRFSSFNNPAYLFSVRETRRVALQRDGNTRASRWCAGCHDPVPFLSGEFDDPNYDDVNHPTAKAGITCTVCHAMVHINSLTGNGDYTLEEPLHYPGAYSANPLAQWLNNQLLKAKPDFHKRTFLKPFHRSAEFCSVCHKVSLPMAVNHYKEFLRGQNHYDTFLLSGVSGHGARSFYYPAEAKTRCADCHMPLVPSSDFGSRDFDGSGVRKVHSHRFLGANTGVPALVRFPGYEQAIQAHRDFLRGTDPSGTDQKLRIDLFGLKPGGTITSPLLAPLRPELPALEPGGTYLVEVVLRTLGMGHPFTQGTVDSNEVWVDFQATAGGRVIGRNGALDAGADEGAVDEWAHFVNVLMLDREGRRIDRRNPQDIFTPLYDHQIPPGAAQVVHYSLRVPEDVAGPVTLTVRLRYRKFDYAYMRYVHGPDQPVPKLPIIDICEDSVTLPVKGVAERVAEQASPIRPSWQRWNDYGIGLFLEASADPKKVELPQAEQAFQRLASLPDKEAQAHAYLNLARVYIEGSQFARAEAALAKAHSADPPPPWWTLAWLTGLVNVQYASFDDAIANFEQILDPLNQPRARKFDFTRDYVVINELSKTLFKRSHQEKDNPAERDRFLRRAVEQFERTLAIDAENIEAHYYLFQCYTRLGEGMPAIPSGAESAGSTGSSMQALARLFADGQAPARERLQVAPRLRQAVADFSKQSPQPGQRKLPIFQEGISQCRAVYQQESDPDLKAAAAQILAELHEQVHLHYKLDDTAKNQAVAEYRKNHKAADHASQPVAIYPLNREGAPGLRTR
jgi:tetratricopeptide (TPR) repeat protein